MPTPFKPKRESYLLSQLGMQWSVLIGVFTATYILALLVSFPTSWIPWALFATLLFTLARANKKWNLTAYEVSETIQRTTGTYFNSSQTALQPKNVTNIVIRQPLFQRTFFNTGNIYVDSAGSQQDSIEFQNVANPWKVKEQLVETLEENGFALHSEEIVHETKPSGVGVTIGVIRTVVSALLAVFLFTTGIFAGQSQIFTDTVMNTVFAIPLVLSVFGAYALYWAARTTTRFTDLYHHTYTVYRDRVERRGGVFTKTYQTVPSENITDTTQNQTVLDRLFKLGTVTVSCAGGASQILYQFLPSPEAFVSAVKQIRNKANTATKEDTPEELEEEPHSFMPEKMRGTLAPLISFVISLPFPPLFFITVPFIYQRLTTTYFSTYTLREEGVTKTFKLFSKKVDTYQWENITGVQRRRTILDYVFGTETIHVYSIGSDSALQLLHQPTGRELTRSILRQKDLEPEKEKTYHAEPTWNVALQCHAYSALALLAGSGVLAALAPTWILPLATLAGISLSIYLFENRDTAVTLHKHYIVASQGVLRHTETFLPYQDIKTVHTTTYLGKNHGTITLEVPGDTFTDQDGQQGIRSGTSTPLLTDPQRIHRHIDACLQDDEYTETLTTPQSKHPTTPVLSASTLQILPISTGTGLLLGFTAGLFTTPLLGTFLGISVASAITTGIIAWDSTKTYSTDHETFYESKGILHQRTKTVLKNKIDYTKNMERWYNKLTGTKHILLYTTGTDTVDSVVKNVKHDAHIVSELS